MSAEFNESIVFCDIQRIICGNITVIMMYYPEILPVTSGLFQGVYLQVSILFPGTKEFLDFNKRICHAIKLVRKVIFF